MDLRHIVPSLHEPDGVQVEGLPVLLLSREEPRAHVHVSCADGEAKFWLEPKVGLVKNHGLSQVQLGEMQKVVEERKDELILAWRTHFSS